MMNTILDWLVPRAHAASFSFALKPIAASGTANASIGALIGTVISYILLVGAGLAVIYLIYSGILYITAAGNPDAAKKGQQGVINAIIGIVIIVLAYFIAQFAVNLATTAAGGTASYLTSHFVS